MFGVRVVGRQVGTMEVSVTFGKQQGGSKMSQSGFGDFGSVCGVTCHSGHILSCLQLC